MDKLQALRVVLAIADEGGLSAAARVLGSSTPAVVRTLASLEASLGVRLFNRTTRKVALTAEGARYLATVRPLLQGLDRAEADARDATGSITGNVVITAPVLLGRRYVGPIAARFIQANPGVGCELRLEDGVLDLVQQSIDVGIRIGVLADSSLVAVPLTSLRRVVVASPDLLQRSGRPAEPGDLLDAPCVQMLASGKGDWSFQRDDERATVPVRGPFRVNHIDTAVQACVAGCGFGQFYSYQVDEQVRQGELVLVLEDHEEAPVPVHAVYPHAPLLPQRTRLLLDALRAGFANVDTLMDASIARRAHHGQTGPAM